MKHPVPRLVRLAVAISLPFVAMGVQRLFWSQIQPHVWYFFLPAVFLGGWLCGRLGAALTTVLSVALMDYYFLDPMQTFRVNDLRQVLSMAFFASVGLLFASLLPRQPLGAIGIRASLEALHPAGATAPGALEKIKTS